jgi:hypothetical protein
MYWKGGAMSGAMLETWLVSEIIKSYLHHGRTPRLYFYRDKDKREVDVLIEENGTIYPIEIKKTASIQNMHFKGFDMLNTLGMPIGHGGGTLFYKCFAATVRRVGCHSSGVYLTFF